MIKFYWLSQSYLNSFYSALVPSFLGCASIHCINSCILLSICWRCAPSRCYIWVVWYITGYCFLQRSAIKNWWICELPKTVNCHTHLPYRHSNLKSLSCVLPSKISFDRSWIILYTAPVASYSSNSESTETLSLSNSLSLSLSCGFYFNGARVFASYSGCEPASITFSGGGSIGFSGYCTDFLLSFWATSSIWLFAQ